MSDRLRDSHCISCGNEIIEFDAVYGFYYCQSCSSYWGYVEDDPDLDEGLDYAEVMEQIYQVDPCYWAKLKEGR